MEAATPSQRRDANNDTGVRDAEVGGASGELGAQGEGGGRPAGPRWTEVQIEVNISLNLVYFFDSSFNPQLTLR